MRCLFPPALQEAHEPVKATFPVFVLVAIPDQGAVAFWVVSPLTASSATALAMLRSPWKYFKHRQIIVRLPYHKKFQLLVITDNDEWQFLIKRYTCQLNSLTSNYLLYTNGLVLVHIDIEHKHLSLGGDGR